MCYMQRDQQGDEKRAGGHVRDPQIWRAPGEAVIGGCTHIFLAECRGQGRADRQTKMTTVSRPAMTLTRTREKARSTGHVARAGESPSSVFLSQNQSQAVGHWTFPGTAKKKPVSCLASALDTRSDQATTVSLPQPSCGLACTHACLWAASKKHGPG